MAVTLNLAMVAEPRGESYLGEGTVVPEVALVGEAVADEAELALLGVLLDGVQELVLGDLSYHCLSASTLQSVLAPLWQQARGTDLLLGIGPARDLDDHVKDGLLGIGVERDVVEGRDGHTVLFDVHAVLERVGGGDLADAVGGRHGAGGRQVTGYLHGPESRDVRRRQQ